MLRLWVCHSSFVVDAWVVSTRGRRERRCCELRCREISPRPCLRSFRVHTQEWGCRGARRCCRSGPSRRRPVSHGGCPSTRPPAAHGAPVSPRPHQRSLFLSSTLTAIILVCVVPDCGCPTPQDSALGLSSVRTLPPWRPLPLPGPAVQNLHDD